MGGENPSSRSPDEAGSSYNVDVPSGLWKQLTPETGGHEVTARVKRRLLVKEDERREARSPAHLESSAQTQEDQVTALMEEERRRQQELLQDNKVKGSLSPATRKALERKKLTLHDLFSIQ